MLKPNKLDPNLKNELKRWKAQPETFGKEAEITLPDSHLVKAGGLVGDAPKEEPATPARGSAKNEKSAEELAHEEYQQQLMEWARAMCAENTDEQLLNTLTECEPEHIKALITAEEQREEPRDVLIAHLRDELALREPN